MRDRRTFQAELRAVPGSHGKQFWTMPLAYEVVDDYGSIWTAGVFDRSVREKFPALMWGHAGWNDITQMMGGAIDYRDTNGGPEALYELLDFDAQPNARILAALIEERATGTPFVRDMSVGFDREEWDGPGGQRELAASDREMRDRKGRPAIERLRVAGWDESSLVVAGAVPGAKALEGARMVEVRGGLMVTHEVAMDTARKIAAGEITREEGDEFLRLVAQGDGALEPEVVVPTTDDETDAVLAEADAALDALEG